MCNQFFIYKKKKKKKKKEKESCTCQLAGKEKLCYIIFLYKQEI